GRYQPAHHRDLPPRLARRRLTGDATWTRRRRPGGLERAGGPRYTYVMADPDLDERLRLAVFAHLDRVSVAHPDGIPSSVINSFTFDGEPMRLVVQPGIWKPARLSAALTIRTTYTPPGRTPPYEDRVGPDGLVRYKWRGTDPEESDNR